MSEELAGNADRHERVRFRRDEIVDLGALPSAAGVAVPPTPRKRWSRPLRWGVRAVGAAAALVAVVLGALAYISNSGLGAERVRAAAEAALERSFGSDLTVAIDTARFSLHGPGLLNLELNKVNLSEHGSKVALLNAGQLRLGISVLPLLTGRLQVTTAEVVRAEIAADQLPPSQGGGAFRQIFDARGVVDPDLLLAAIFDAADAIGRTADTGGAPDVRLSEISLVLSPGLPFSKIDVMDARLHHAASGVELAGQVAFDERQTQVSATIERSGKSRRVDKFKIEFRADKQGTKGKSFSFGELAVTFDGDRSVAGAPAKVSIGIDADELSVDLGTRGRLDGQIDATASLVDKSGKIEIDRLNSVVGNSAFHMTGAFGPNPLFDGKTGNPNYRFELVSNDSLLSPQGTDEAQMPMSLRLAGGFRPDTKVLNLEQIAIATQSGTATGNGSVTLTKTGAPGLTLALDVSDMSVAHVKQLWPWFAAESARRWVNANLVGGSVPEGQIRLSVAPGRLGNGQRLGGNEVSGIFKVNDTRFDTTGAIPPIRDADGTVSFAGDDVDISLERGQLFLASGLAVGAEGGRLVIKDAGVPPVIGQLDINISGPAAAIAELASLRPINVMERTGITPASLSGSVEGKVNARIPMQKGVDKSLLDWNIELAYRDLSIAKAIDGQMITDADGSILVDRSKAVIRGDAKLNGVPAKLDLTEPFGGSQAARQRKIILALSDKDAQRLVPGLDGIVDGPIKVEVDASRKDRQRIEADLTAATLALPFVGWTKGSGIPAKASFDLERQGATTKLSNFALAGKTFGINGVVNVENGAIATARFDRFRLNRDDNFSVVIGRSGSGYSVNLTGEALDARALIKNATSRQSGSASAGKSKAISLKGSLGRMIGFNGENLSGVTLSYASNGGGSSDLSLQGSSQGGRAISIQNSRGGGIEVQAQDAGALLRFLDIYERVQGGLLSIHLVDGGGGSYAGSLDARDFYVVNEPKLGSIVSATPQGSGGSLNEATKTRIDTTRMRFDRGFANIETSKTYLRLSKGVLRGPSVGTTFQGTVYDENNRMQMTGTFMPAYGLNRIFGDIPLVGALLGNGNDKGLIGVTYKLTGNYKSPQLQINPLSAIAPGIFRSIFEFQ